MSAMAGCGPERAPDRAPERPQVAHESERAQDRAPQPRAAPAATAELPTFAAYAALRLLRGEPAPVNLASHPDGERLAERFLAEAEGPPDFAGSFRIVSWGCGTHCTTGMVIDLRDGSLHTLPTAELGLEYRAESSLLIINPHPETLFAIGETPDWARTRYLYWDGERFHLLGPLFVGAPSQ
jgi:hypothetical protein